jgi:hypothetical protein
MMGMQKIKQEQRCSQNTGSSQEKTLLAHRKDLPSNGLQTFIRRSVFISSG